MLFDRGALNATLASARRALLYARNAEGFWEGGSASIAAATATAVFALHRYRIASNNAADIHANDRRCAQLISAGVGWLALHQNADGGWGDTARRVSDVGTTCLCWAAFTADGAAAPGYASTVRAAEAWLATTAGGLAPDRIAASLSEQYGVNRGGSVPILAMCALSGRLGESRAAWALVPQLRVAKDDDSHAALVAINLARQANRPSRNPIARAADAALRGRAMRSLERVPHSLSGNADAVPQTAFVVMSLCSAGEVESPIVRQGIGFLLRSARASGGWPRHPGSALRMTALAADALFPAMAGSTHLSTDDASQLRGWLLAQLRHPEHQNGGLTAAAIIALRALREETPAQRPTRSSSSNTAEPLRALRQSYDADAPIRDAAIAGIDLLLSLQNGDGGISPAASDRSETNLTADALRAFRAWAPELEAPLRARVHDASMNAVRFLVQNQGVDGSWSSPATENRPANGIESSICTTSCVVRAAFSIALKDGLPLDWPQALWRGVRRLLDAQHGDGGWGNGVSPVEASAPALEALAHVMAHDGAVRAGIDPERDDHWAVFHKMDEVLIDGEQDAARLRGAVEHGVAWLIEQGTDVTAFDPESNRSIENLFSLISTVLALSQASAALQT